MSELLVMIDASGPANPKYNKRVMAILRALATHSSFDALLFDHDLRSVHAIGKNDQENLRGIKVGLNRPLGGGFSPNLALHKANRQWGYKIMIVDADTSIHNPEIQMDSYTVIGNGKGNIALAAGQTPNFLRAPIYQPIDGSEEKYAKGLYEDFSQRRLASL